ncbi:n-acetylglutamate synthase [Bacillus sp. NPDC077027]|uniref:n-acetylglutamate synthase n=1 Tax=Bacillus sp. NPDC077027 TaxID=3390548 RepID=UPI003CFF3D9E
MFQYDGKTFIPQSNSENGEVSSATMFHYRQESHILTGAYKGGSILSGVLVGTVNDDGTLQFRYHHVNEDDSMRSRSCYSVPKQLDHGKIQLHEKWKWMDGDLSEGESVIEEL